MPHRLLFTALALTFASFVAVIPAVAANDRGHVQASLVAAEAAVQPGQPLTVAIRFLHDPHWHTYWKSPGTGLPTELKWELPPGWTAGEIQWPAPRVLKDRSGNIVGNGYEGELFLPVTLIPPTDLKPGGTVELKVAADWLECEDVCMPGSADLSLTLPVIADSPQADPTWGEKIRTTLANLPRLDPSWNVAAGRKDKTVTLHLTPAAGARPPAPRTLHFFAEENFIGYDLPQKITPDGRGGYVLTLSTSPEAPDDARRLVGVLTSESGWNNNAAQRGLAVEVPLGNTLAAVPGGESGSGTTGASSVGSAGAIAGATSAAAGGGIFTTLLLALLGGLILNFMPCVFPVLGIKILGFVNQAGHQRGKIIAHGLVFSLGVLLSFWALAALLAVLRAGGDQLGWGFQLQSPAFVYVLAVLLLVFGLNLSGVFEFGLSATAVGSGLQGKSGYNGSFFTGVLATVVATPCSAPFLAPALGAALAVSTLESFAIFTAIAIGLALPYLLLSIFPQAIKVLPRPGAWMETFKQFMAFPLYATVGFLVWVLAAQTSEDGFLYLLFSLVLIALAVWLYGRWHAPGAKPARARLGLVGLLVIGALGLWVGWPSTAARGPAVAGQSSTGVNWQPWSPEAVAELRQQGRIVYVDFTARWCATCQTNKKIVFSSDEVLRAFADRNVATLKADWTNKDPRITAELAKYQRSAVPFNVIWVPGQEDPVILPELLTPGIVLEALPPAEKPAGKSVAAN